jgi:hypothetical protein
VAEWANQIAAEALVIRTLGSTELADSALEAAERLSELLQVSNPTRQLPREFVPQEPLASAMSALVDFRIKVRDSFDDSELVADRSRRPAVT